jgi:hypothetical protein
MVSVQFNSKFRSVHKMESAEDYILIVLIRGNGKDERSNDKEDI